jgi:signal peptidase I
VSINFPLFLVLATAFTGLVWLIDARFLRSRRADSAVEPILVEYSISFFPVLLIVLVLRSFLAEPFQIPTGSMIPTLMVGDFIVVNKFAYGIRLPVVGTRIIDVGEPNHGDVMVFIPPHEPEYFIKRVVGLPGDSVRYQNKTLYINGVEQPQTSVEHGPADDPRTLIFEETLGGVPHIIHLNKEPDPQTQAWEIPEGHYFVMGDNRDQSADSRYWGLVSESAIVGKAFAVWLHKEPGWHLPGFSRNGWIQ